METIRNNCQIEEEQRVQEKRMLNQEKYKKRTRALRFFYSSSNTIYFKAFCLQFFSLCIENNMDEV